MGILRDFSNPNDSVILQLWSLPSLSTAPLPQRAGWVPGQQPLPLHRATPPYTKLSHSHILPALGPATLCNIKTPSGTWIYHSWLLLKSVAADRGVGGGSRVVGWGRGSTRPWLGSAALVKAHWLWGQQQTCWDERLAQINKQKQATACLLASPRCQI